jgi:hypothetical protein
MASSIEAGTLIVNVEPCPRALSTKTSPPISRQIFISDGHAQPRASVLSRGRGVGLLEGLEQAADLLGCHPDPRVDDPED